MLIRNHRALALVAVLLSALLTLAAAGCGEEENVSEIVEGEEVELGEISYNVLFSRYLNGSDVEDAAYVQGLGEPPLDQIYFALFVEIENHSDEPQQLPELSELVIRDTQEVEYEPLETESVYALEAGVEIPAGGELPVADSPAATGPVEGSLILYSLPYAATELRPLELIIPGEGGPAQVELDL